METFSKIFKKSFLEGYVASDINVKYVLLTLVVTLVISAYIFLIYRVVTRKTFYSLNFNISLVGMALITAAIILTIQSSIVVSLGMVGALSIVRFRTAVKEPMDLVFLYWAISTGIICGAGYAEFAIILALILSVAIFVFNKLPITYSPQILIISVKNVSSESQITDIVRQYCKYFKVRSRSAINCAMDIVYEIRTDKGDVLVETLCNMENVAKVSLLKHEGEVTI